jgi:hypothetical protein
MQTQIQNNLIQTATLNSLIQTPILNSLPWPPTLHPGPSPHTKTLRSSASTAVSAVNPKPEFPKILINP